MIYLIAANEPDLDAKISKRFGHAPYYLILNSETLEFTSIKGPDQDEPSDEFSRFAEAGARGAILGNVGPFAFEKLRGLGWDIYSCTGSTVREAVEKVTGGEVDPLSKPTMKRSVRQGSHR